MVWGLLVGFLRGKEEEEKKKGGVGVGVEEVVRSQDAVSTARWVDR